MSMSGVKVAQECIELFNYMKLKSSKVDGPNYKYAIFKPSDDKTEVVVEEKVESKCETNTREEDAEVFEELKGRLSKAEPRYIVYDMRFHGSRSLIHHLIVISWSPDEAKIEKKMLLAATVETFKKKLVGFKNFFKASDMDEMNYNTFADAVEGI